MHQEYTWCSELHSKDDPNHLTLLPGGGGKAIRLLVAGPKEFKFGLPWMFIISNENLITSTPPQLNFNTSEREKWKQRFLYHSPLYSRNYDIEFW